LPYLLRECSLSVKAGQLCIYAAVQCRTNIHFDKCVTILLAEGVDGWVTEYVI